MVTTGDSGRLPIGVCLRTIDARPDWWLESARRLDAAGYAGLWAWDHFIGRGDLTVPVVENWTILSMAAGATQRATIGSFVINVMNRHPALLARMAATLQIGSAGGMSWASASAAARTSTRPTAWSIPMRPSA